MSEQVGKEETKQKKHRIFKSAAHIHFSLRGFEAVAFKELLRTFQTAIDDDEMPIEIHVDKLTIKALDRATVKMANYVFGETFFEKWSVRPYSNYKMAELPIRFKVPIAEVNYAIEKVTEDSTVNFEITVVFNSWKAKVEVRERVPERCPKCGLYTVFNKLPPEKRGKDGRSYKCGCGWRGKVRERYRKVKVVNKEVADITSLKIVVEERTAESFEIKVFKDEGEEVPKPVFPPKAEAKVVAKDFRAILERMQKKTQCVTIKGTENKLTLSGASDLLGMTIELKKHGDIVLDIKAENEQEAVYSLDNIIPILPNKPSIAQIVSLKFATDMPLIVSWHLQQNSSCSVDFYIAPRIYT